MDAAFSLTFVEEAEPSSELPSRFNVVEEVDTSEQQSEHTVSSIQAAEAWSECEISSVSIPPYEQESPLRVQLLHGASTRLDIKSINRELHFLLT